MPRNENGQLEPGTLLAGRYRIERFLAGGGMGLVYVAHDLRLADRRCAIKEIFDRFTSSEERARAIEYFHREADTLAQLKHPSVPAIFDRFGEGNCHYLVMDFIEGTNLEEDLAARGGVLPEGRVIDIARELCDVLSYLHSFRPPIIYRDMKPGNVILTPAGRVVLIDFGIARIFSPQGKATLIGTPGFAPPEQYAGTVDERSDIYSLAATLHYLITGRDPEKNPPFSFPPVHTLKPDASPFLAGAIDKALSYKMEERPPSAAAFKEMLLYGRGLDGARAQAAASKAATQPLEPLEAPAAVVGAPRPRRAGRWGRRIAALILFGLFAGTAYGVYTHPEFADPDHLMRLGERIPWQRVEALLPEWGQTRFRKFVENLPWEREKRLRALRADPIEVVSLKILNTSRDGTSLPQQKATYTEDEVQYLTWEAVLKNRLAGVEGTTYRLEGRFFDPEGGLAGRSEVGRFVRPDEEQVELRGITLLEGLKERAKGNYQFELYFGDRKLESQTVGIEPTPETEVKQEKPAEEVKLADARPPVAAPVLSPAPAVVEAERKRLAEEAKRIALIQERSKKPLELKTIRFLNTDKNGKRLSQPGTTFSASDVRFVAWEAVFRNRLHDLVPSYHRVEATYYGPNGQPLGTVQDGKEVPADSAEATFTGRIGNAKGGAFTPGTYRVDFYVNGWPLSSKEFVVEDDRDVGRLLRHHVGSMLGLVPGREVALEITFRPRGDGSLHGDLIIHEPGYGVAPLEGRTDGFRIEFRSPIGRETYHFQGWREEGRLIGTYTVSPSGAGGRWSVRIGGAPAS
ncbi:MAG: protein kinase [Thermodesulfobacteriota bacterium]